MQSQNSQLQELEVLASIFRENAIGASNIADALIFATLYGRLHWLNISGFFGDDLFEKQLYDRWSGTLFGDLDNVSSPTADGWVHVASKFYPHGGHTRLFWEMFEGLRDKGVKQSLIITRKIDRNAGAILDGLKNQITFLDGTITQRAHGVFQNAAHSKTVVFHTHPNDIGAALAARALRDLGCQVLFVNHADHVFSFGPGASSAVLEICATGWRATRERRTAEAQCFLGIPAPNHTMVDTNFERDPTGPIVSVGIQQKYEPNEQYNFAVFLDDLMDEVPNDVLLIGPKVKSEMWQPLLKKYDGRLQILGPQPKEFIEMTLETASCYVDSFPLDGGTMFTQALMHGVPVFGPSRPSALGISPVDTLRVDTIGELIVAIKRHISDPSHSSKYTEVASQVDQILSREAVVCRLQNAATKNYANLPESLEKLGNRSIDSNALVWKRGGTVNLPRDTWRGLTVGARVQFWRHSKYSELSPRIIKEIGRRLIAG